MRQAVSPAGPGRPHYFFVYPAGIANTESGTDAVEKPVDSIVISNTDPPPAPATFLNTNERAIIHFVGGGEELFVSQYSANFLEAFRALAPRLVVVVLVAGDFDVYNGAFPDGRRAALFILGHEGAWAKEEECQKEWDG